MCFGTRNQTEVFFKLKKEAESSASFFLFARIASLVNIPAGGCKIAGVRCRALSPFERLECAV